MGKRKDHLPPKGPVVGSVAYKLAEAREDKIAKANAIGRKAKR